MLGVICVGLFIYTTTSVGSVAVNAVLIESAM